MFRFLSPSILSSICLHLVIAVKERRLICNAVYWCSSDWSVKSSTFWGIFCKGAQISEWIFKCTLENSSLTHLLFATKCYLKYLVRVFYLFSVLVFLFNLPLFACFQRFYDLLGGTTVWGMGPVFQHEAVTDNAWPPGTEQGKLEGSAEGTVGQWWRCWPHFWGNGLRHFTSGTSIVLTSISMTKLPLPSVSAQLD